MDNESNMRQQLVRAVAPILNESNLEVDWERDPATGQIIFKGGMAINILRDLQTILNFSLELIPGDFAVTSIQPTSANMTLSFKPVTADLLQSRQVDIMIGHTTPLPSRLKSLDILFPSSYNRLFAYVHQPPANYARDLYSHPFYPKLWIALAVTWTLLLLSTHLFTKFLPTKVPTDIPFTSNYSFWTLVIVFQKGCVFPPESLHLRSVFYLSVFLTSVLFNAYCAAITSILSTKEIPIPNLTSLFRSSLPIYAALESSSIASVIKSLQTQGKISSHKNPFLPTSLGVTRLFHRPFAFIAYDHFLNMMLPLQNISNQNFCSKITSFQLTKTRLATSMTMPKNSPLKPIFNQKLLVLQERGHLHRHQNSFHLQSSVQCLVNSIPYKFPLAVDDLFTALLIPLIAFLLSITVLIFEHFFSPKNKT